MTDLPDRIWVSANPVEGLGDEVCYTRADIAHNEALEAAASVAFEWLWQNVDDTNDADLYSTKVTAAIRSLKT